MKNIYEKPKFDVISLVSKSDIANLEVPVSGIYPDMPESDE